MCALLTEHFIYRRPLHSHPCVLIFSFFLFFTFFLSLRLRARNTRLRKISRRVSCETYGYVSKGFSNLVSRLGHFRRVQLTSIIVRIYYHKSPIDRHDSNNRMLQYHLPSLTNRSLQW